MAILVEARRAARHTEVASTSGDQGQARARGGEAEDDAGGGVGQRFEDRAVLEQPYRLVGEGGEGRVRARKPDPGDGPSGVVKAVVQAETDEESESE